MMPSVSSSTEGLAMKRPPKTKSKAREINPKDMFDQGTRFAYADKFLRQADLDIDKLFLMSQPSMVLSSFASELFLKCILHLDAGHAPPTHNLDTLFRKLPNQRKRRIQEIWEDHLRKNAPNYAALLQLRQISPNVGDCLKDCRDAFVLLRYAYEDPERVVFYLGEFAYLLRQAILEFKPEWRLSI
jgi:HEPN domain-containing protein